MIRIIVSAIAMATIFLSQAQACLIQPRANEPLYQVVNDFFPNDEVRFASNWELLLTSILPDGSISLILNEDDPQWLPIGEELTLDAIYRQERPQFRRGHTDLRDSGSIVDLFENQYGARYPKVLVPDEDIRFAVSEDFTELLFGDYRHFLVFAIDPELLSAFVLGADYFDGDDVWLIAFESWGRLDFTDFVAVVSHNDPLTPVPLPGAFVLMGSALAGLLGTRIRRR